MCPGLGAAMQRAVSTYRSGFESSPAGPQNRPHERLKRTTARCSPGLCSALAAFIVPTKLGLGAWSPQGSSLNEEGGAPALRSRLSFRGSAPLTTAANQRPARRGHFLVGRQGGLRSSLVRVSRIGCARVPERPRPAQAWRPIPVCVWGSRGRAWQLRVAPCPSHLPNRSNQVRARRAARAGVQAAGRGAGVPDEPPRAPSAPLARTVQPPKWWQHLGRGHFLIARRVTVKLEFLTGRRTGSALRLGGVCTRCLRGPEESRLGTRGLRGALESCTRAASGTVWSVTLSALRIKQCRSVVRPSALLRVTLAN